MFEKIKQLGKLRDLQKSLEKEEVEIEKEGVKVVMNGNLKVVEIVLNPDKDIRDQERLLKDCFNQAIEKVKIQTASKLQSIF